MRDLDSLDDDSRNDDARTPEPIDPTPSPAPEASGFARLLEHRAIDVRSVALAGLFAISAVLALRLARELFLPVVLAILLKFLLSPVARLLERLRIPAAIASFLVLLAVVVGLGTVIAQIAEPAQAWMTELPMTLKRAEEKMLQLREPVAAVAEVARQVDELAGNDTQAQDQSVQLETATLSESIFAGMWALAGTAAVAIALLYFLLASGDLFLLKMVRVLTRLRDKKRAVEIARQIESDVSTYLVTITLINLSLGAAVTLAMYWLGMPTPLLWGVMAASFNFVPYLGAAVGVAVLALASFLNLDQLSQMVVPPLVYLGLTAFEGVVVTPLILGHRLSLNPVAIFLGLIFWGWLWGTPGALLAVPMMVALKIVCDHVPPLSAAAEFMGR